jgi:hypothetical protein
MYLIYSVVFYLFSYIFIFHSPKLHAMYLFISFDYLQTTAVPNCKTKQACSVSVLLTAPSAAHTAGAAPARDVPPTEETQTYTSKQASCWLPKGSTAVRIM